MKKIEEKKEITFRKASQSSSIADHRNLCNKPVKDEHF